MCKASSILSQLQAINDTYQREKKRLVKMQSELDREINKIYHDLEARGNLNAAQGYFVARDLQMVLRKRRIVKQELFKLNAVNQPLNMDKMPKGLSTAQRGLRKIENDREDSYTKNWNLKLEDFEEEFATN